MKQVLFIPLFFFLSGSSNLHASLQGLIAAERGFAQRSLDENTRAAFLANLDKDGIVFQKGEPVNGHEVWKALEPNESYLYWWPVYADIAASGDFGYTTGPAEFGGERTNPEPARGIYYSTVWRKNDEGVWKVAIDLGSAKYTPGPAKTDVTTPVLPPATGRKKINIEVEKQNLVELDQTYLTKLHETKKSLLPAYFHTEARIHHGGREPITTQNEIKQFSEDGAFTFEHLGGQIASSGDMGFTYGKVKLDREKDGTRQTLPLNYLRIWKKEKGIYKIVLDVIGG